MSEGIGSASRSCKKRIFRDLHWLSAAIDNKSGSLNVTFFLIRAHRTVSSGFQDFIHKMGVTNAISANLFDRRRILVAVYQLSAFNSCHCLNQFLYLAHFLLGKPLINRGL